MEAVIAAAWGVHPFDHYGLSEHPNCGCACRRHRGIHLFEDVCIVDVVDNQNRLVPPWTTGFKPLPTNLYNFTQPLIRYEVSDMLTIDPVPCPCGRPFRLVAKISGRNDDTVYLPGKDGRLHAIHPLHFYDAMEPLESVKQYQVVENADRLLIRVVPRERADRERLIRSIQERIRASLDAIGPPGLDVHVEFVSAIERSPDLMGKAKLVLRPPAADLDQCACD